MIHDSSPEIQRELAIDFSANPLIPAVITDSATGSVLTIGFMNEEAYRKTRETGRTHFWSRSRNKLWKKGETSGHEQIVDCISVNCNLNALLISVQQIGAVCHDGYPSCFYRDIEADETLTITMDRWFDPDIVYGGQSDPTITWYEAYRYLKNQPLDDLSMTSRLLRSEDANFAGRVADELLELSGVLNGTHHHVSLAEDAVLEGSQSLYWLSLAAASQGITWNELRPDRALDTTSPDMSPETASRLLQSESEQWRLAGARPTAQQIYATMALVAQAARSAGVEPQALIAHDLLDLRSKSYLTAYFESR